MNLSIFLVHVFSLISLCVYSADEDSIKNDQVVIKAKLADSDDYYSLKETLLQVLKNNFIAISDPSQLKKTKNYQGLLNLELGGIDPNGIPGVSVGSLSSLADLMAQGFYPPELISKTINGLKSVKKIDTDYPYQIILNKIIDTLNHFSKNEEDLSMLVLDYGQIINPTEIFSNHSVNTLEGSKFLRDVDPNYGLGDFIPLSPKYSIFFDEHNITQLDFTPYTRFFLAFDFRLALQESNLSDFFRWSSIFTDSIFIEDWVKANEILISSGEKADEIFQKYVTKCEINGWKIDYHFYMFMTIGKSFIADLMSTAILALNNKEQLSMFKKSIPKKLLTADFIAQQMVNEYSMTSIKALKSIGVDLSKLESQELINKNNIFNILVNFSNIMESQIKKVNKLGNNIGTRLNKSKTLQLLDAKFSKKVFNIPNFKSPSNENLLKFTMNELPKIVMSYKNENDVWPNAFVGMFAYKLSHSYQDHNFNLDHYLWFSDIVKKLDLNISELNSTIYEVETALKYYKLFYGMFELAHKSGYPGFDNFELAVENSELLPKLYNLLKFPLSSDVFNQYVISFEEKTLGSGFSNPMGSGAYSKEVLRNVFGNLSLQNGNHLLNLIDQLPIHFIRKTHQALKKDINKSSSLNKVLEDSIDDLIQLDYSWDFSILNNFLDELYALELISTQKYEEWKIRIDVLKTPLARDFLARPEIKNRKEALNYFTNARQNHIETKDVVVDAQKLFIPAPLKTPPRDQVKITIDDSAIKKILLQIQNDPQVYKKYHGFINKLSDYEYAYDLDTLSGTMKTKSFKKFFDVKYKIERIGFHVYIRILELTPYKTTHLRFAIQGNSKNSHKGDSKRCEELVLFTPLTPYKVNEDKVSSSLLRGIHPEFIARYNSWKKTIENYGPKGLSKGQRHHKLIMTGPNNEILYASRLSEKGRVIYEVDNNDFVITVHKIDVDHSYKLH